MSPRQRSKSKRPTKAEEALNGEDPEDYYYQHFEDIRYDFDYGYDVDIHPDKVVEEMSRGASIEELCLHLGVLPSVIAQWYHEYDDFRDACCEGYMLSLAWWKAKGRLSLSDSAFSVALYKFEMANRFKYNKVKVTSTDITDPRFLIETVDDALIDVRNMSDEELEKRIDKHG